MSNITGLQQRRIRFQLMSKDSKHHNVSNTKKSFQRLLPPLPLVPDYKESLGYMVVCHLGRAE